ncbi:MAG: YciI family protein [bacterium]|nr:YciI family protein [bacterium]
MKYLILLMDEGDMTPWEEISAEEKEEVMAQHERFDQVCEELDGVRILSAEALQGPETATSVRTRGGEMTVSDGPYAEAVEHLGGFYLIEAPNFDTLLGALKTLPPYGMDIRLVGEVV